MSPRRPYLVVALCVLALVAAACGGGGEPVTFGEGELPSSVPDGFPVPRDAVVGSSMVDRANHRTEFSLTLRGEMADAVHYYTVSLVSAGFVVDRSQGDALAWRIDFSRGEVRGNLVIRSGGPGLAAVLVGLNTS